MLNLFNKKKVFAGKQNNQDEKKPAGAAAGKDTQQAKKPAPFAALGKTWAKLNKMDRKQAYTWGAVVVVGLVALLTLGAAVGGGDGEDFSAFETRGYDLANMPFSTDEAEQYLLASKYPDMQNTQAAGLYTKSEKEARQAEDAAAAETAEQPAAEDNTSSSSSYSPGRYYGGGSSAPVTPTKINSLNSASLKGASGSNMSGTFGPSGDFSNFKNQDKGKDVFQAQQNRGSGDARQALYQSAVGSRAAAGQKDNRLVNAKKAMLGGNIKGSEAFLSDSGAVDLSKAEGLNLDTNAPVSSVDPGLFDDALKEAQEKSEEKAKEEDEQRWWQEQLMELAKWAAQQVLSWGLGEAQSAMEQARATRANEAADWQRQLNEVGAAEVGQGQMNNDSLNDVLGGDYSSQAFMDEMGYSFDPNNQNRLLGSDGSLVATRSEVPVTDSEGRSLMGRDGKPLTESTWQFEENQSPDLSKGQARRINNASERIYKNTEPMGYKAAKKVIRANHRQMYQGGTGPYSYRYRSSGRLFDDYDYYDEDYIGLDETSGKTTS